MSQKSGEITAAGSIELGDAHGAIVSGWLIHFTDNSSGSWTADVQGKAIKAAQGAYKTFAYKDMNSGTIKTAQLNTAGLSYVLYFDAAGSVLKILTGAISSGGVYYDAQPVIG